MREVFLSEIVKVIISDKNEVQYFEYMGERWIALGEPEVFSEELIQYYFYED